MKLYNSILAFTTVFIFSSQPGYVAEKTTDPLGEAKEFFAGTNEKLSDLRFKVLGIEHIIENDCILEEDNERFEIAPEQLSESIEMLVKELDEVFSQQAASIKQESLSRVKKALEEFRTVKEKKLPHDKAAMQISIKKLVSEILGTEHTLYSQFAVPTPLDPLLGMNWMIQALNFWHTYLYYAEEGEHAPLFETIETTAKNLNQELETRSLSEDQKGDMMVALMDLWNIGTFKDKVEGQWAQCARNVKSFLPKPLPQAALLYSLAHFDDTHAEMLLKTSGSSAKDQIFQLIQSSCDKALRAAEILETQDTVPTDLLFALSRQFKIITQGISRSLGIELLLQTYLSLKMYELPEYKIPGILALKQQLAARALRLTTDMQFSSEIGDQSKYYQMLAFMRLSQMYENPIQRYVYVLVANRIYKGATYKGSQDQLASYFGVGDTFARCFYLNREQKFLTDRVCECSGEAYGTTVQEAESLFQDREKAASLQEKLVILARTDALAILAANIAGEIKPEESTEDTPEKPSLGEKIDTAKLVPLKASVDQELSLLLDDLISKHTQEFEEALSSIEEMDDASFKAHLMRAKAQRTELFQVNKAVEESFNAISENYNHYKLEWKFTKNANIQKVFELCESQQKRIRSILSSRRE